MRSGAGLGNGKVAAAARVAVPARQDEPLIEQAINGDQRAFEQLYRTNVGRVYAVCLRMTANRAEAEECTQMTFVKAWQKLASFKRRSALSTWLHRIAVNEVLAQKRSAARRRNYLEVVEDLPPGSDADHSFAGTVKGFDIEGALQTLPDGARQVFVLCAVYGYSHLEAAETLGLAVGTTKAQLHRARKLLKTRLDK